VPRPAHRRAAHRPADRHRSVRRALAAALALGLGFGAIQVLSPAEAGSTVLRRVSSASDAGVLDRNGDGIGDVAPYGLHRGSLPVGRLSGGGGDVRVVLPFQVTKAAVDAMDRGGKANVSVRVWRVDHLGARRLTVESVSTTSGVTASAFAKQSSRVARLAPIEGRVAVDVSSAVRGMSKAGTLTLRLRLDGSGGRNGRPPQVAVALSEARNPSNRPVLTVSTPAAAPRRPSRPPRRRPPPRRPPRHPRRRRLRRHRRRATRSSATTSTAPASTSRSGARTGSPAPTARSPSR
jgi:hypothetical protein